MKDLIIDQDIPGWNLPDIQFYLAELVSKLAADSNILEIGAFFGRTTYVLGHNKPINSTLYTIDPWMTYDLSHFTTNSLHDNRCSRVSLDLIAHHTSENPTRIEGDDFFKLWKIFIGDIQNHHIVREFSPPTIHVDWPEFDFIYHDAAHDETTVYQDLCFWFPKLKPGGCMIMDDYKEDQFPGLYTSVNRYVNENNLQTSMIGSRNIRINKSEDSNIN